MASIRISIIQTPIVWENKTENLRMLHEKLIQLRGTTEIVVLPEMFTTGFSMQSFHLAEPIEGNTMCLLHEWASTYHLALCGSYLASENKQYFNRAFFITPDRHAYYYDKRHLFRMGEEHRQFTPGHQPLIVSYLGWNIQILICYDLRFPVWSRNVGNSYDLLIYVANWPAKRQLAWDTLLRARAIENQCYVCGVNCIGKDGYHQTYHGGSIIYSDIGETLLSFKEKEESIGTATLSLDKLQENRKHFPAWKDADPFHLLVF